MSEIIRYENIGMAYGDNEVIKDFNLSIEAGEFISIIGTSGSGKTTILKMVNRLNHPTEGTIYIHGEDIKKKDIIQLRRNIGYAIQGSVLFPHMTVEQNIAYVPNLLNKKNKEKTNAAVHKWLKLVDLDESLLARYPDELSGGQQQRVGIARALAASPDILLMDEPFGAVDEITRAALQEELKKLHQKTNITMLFVTHNISEALYLGTKVLVMHDGKIQQYDTPENIVNHPKTDYVKLLVKNQKKI
jgi:osmoprotectant transport system ATP-binding protein